MEQKNFSAGNKRPDGAPSLVVSPFENAITEGRQRKARVGRPTGNHIGEAVTNVHGRRGVAVVKQKIKIGPALRAA
jgi:hypothetical protein